MSFRYTKSAQNPQITDESSGYSSGSPSDEQIYSSEEQPDIPTIPAGCTCGNCRLYTLCKRGCLNPGLAIGGGAQLPIRNGMGVGDEDIELSFGRLVIETCTSFKEKGLREKIVLLLKQLSLFGNRMDEVHEAEYMEKLFEVFSDKWSWYNHSLLKDLINEFGDDQDRTRFLEYHTKFISFLKNPLPKSQSEFNFGTGCGKGQMMLRIKVNENWDTTTLEQVSQIHHNIARILEVQLRDLYLASVSKGCICLEFLVSESMAIPLCASQEEALMVVGVFRLECGDYLFQVFMNLQCIANVPR